MQTRRIVCHQVAIINLILAMVLGAPLMAADAPKAGSAQPILDSSGVREGLCIHLGAGREATAALTADLAAGSKMLVHGLALDEAALTRARKAIEAAGAAGQAQVEKVGVNPLPYLNDLANLVVIEDLAALESQGLKMDEVMRVTAPGGVICTFAGGKWTKTIKPRSEKMDDWTHPNHGADGNMVSQDRVVGMPVGFRWIDGLPENVNRWASCRAWVAAGGRLFMLTTNVVENVSPSKAKTHYLTAHNAWNGLPLWKVNCETTDDGAFLTSVNYGALATDGKLVYAVQKDKAVAFDAATGEKRATFQSKYRPERLLLTDGLLVAATWEDRDPSKSPSDAGSLWAPWVPKSDVGTVEAFDCTSGSPKWKIDSPADQIIAADGTVYLLTQKGNPPTERSIVAVDAATGKPRWTVPHTRFGEEPDLQINTAGKGYVVIAKRGDAQGLGTAKKPEGEKPRLRAIYVLSAAEGKTLWEINPAKSYWTPVVDGMLWYQSKKYDPLTGKDKGNIGWGVGDQFCTPQMIVNNYIVRPRGGQFIQLPQDGKPSKDMVFGGARGACIEGMVPANGMFYTAQNNCECMPGQIYGFLAVGPCGEWPAAADFQKPRDVEKGPAFGSTVSSPSNGKETAAAENDGDWPTYRHDAQRTAATKSPLPAKLKQLWSVPVAKPFASPLGEAWKARLGSCLSAPVVAGGKVFVARTDAGQIVSVDAATGKEVWTATFGGRVDTPPTIHKGLCLVGSHDGYLYALRADDGQFAWRLRVAPWDRRMVAYGQVESVWPAVGTVLAQDGVAYANAGRTSESDGGIAVVAVDPATGANVWAKAIAPGPQRMNDLLAIRNGQLAWYNVRLDAKTGEAKPAATFPKDASQGGMLDGTWAEFNFRRSGKGFWAGQTVANILAWNESLIIGPAGGNPPDAAKPAWALSLPRTNQVEAIALTPGAAIVAGRITGAKDKAGFLAVLSPTDGNTLGEFPLPCPPTFDGLAVGGGCVYVSMQDGSLICFGKAD